MNKLSYKWYTNGKNNLKVYSNTDIPDGFYPGRYMEPLSEEKKKEMIRKMKETSFKRYGNSTYNNQEKRKETCIKLYGVDYAMKLDVTKEKVKNTCLEVYGVENPSQAESIKTKIKECWKNKSEEELKSILEKRIETTQEIYGVENVFQSETIKEKCSNTKLLKYGDENYKNIDKAKQTKLSRYGDENYNNREKANNTCLERYGVTCYSKTKEYKNRLKPIRKEMYRKAEDTLEKKYGSLDAAYKLICSKRNESLRKNNSFNRSNMENNLYYYLLNYFKEDIKRNYSDSVRYPFKCDFYIPSKDLFVELNAHWTHGNTPYDSNDVYCQNKLKNWQEKAKTSKFYKNAIYTWTDLDVRKAEIAKKNNLNYIVIYNKKLSELLENLESQSGYKVI